MRHSPKFKFFLTNFIKGLIWLAIILAIYFSFEKIVLTNAPDVWIEQFYAKPLIIYVIYIISEFFIGIIPPEIFMIWGMKRGGTMTYISIVAFLAVISYLMGYLTFLIGKMIHKKVSFRYIRMKFFRQTWPQLKKYGIFLIIVAALTPVPWSGTCLLVGSAGYPSDRYLKFALFRILRYAVYGFIVFQMHHF